MDFSMVESIHDLWDLVSYQTIVHAADASRVTEIARISAWQIHSIASLMLSIALFG